MPITRPSGITLPMSEDAHQAFVDNLRRLMEVSVRVRGDDAELGALATELAAMIERLERHVPDPPHSRYPTEHGCTLEEIFRYDFVMGERNPVAVPLRFANQGTKSIATATFGDVYEGPPGCVHGAVIAGVFDQVLNVANLLAGSAGPTVRLETKFHKPTPLYREIRFEGQVRKVEGKRIFTDAKCIAGDIVTVEAHGVFVCIDFEKIQSLGDLAK